MLTVAASGTVTANFTGTAAVTLRAFTVHASGYYARLSRTFGTFVEIDPRDLLTR